MEAVEDCRPNHISNSLNENFKINFKLFETNIHFILSVHKNEIILNIKNVLSKLIKTSTRDMYLVHNGCVLFDHNSVIQIFQEVMNILKLLYTCICFLINIVHA